MKREQSGRRLVAVIILQPWFFLATVLAAPACFATSSILDQDCILRLADSADGSMTLEEVREQCSATAATENEPESPDKEGLPESLVEKRLAEERRVAASPFSILAHKPNYFLVAAYNWEGWESNDYQHLPGNPEYENDDVESQFQLSLKVPLAVGLFGDRMDVYGAYTNRSFWQMYNSEYSEPFRETNHEPEVWAQFGNDWNVLGMTNMLNSVGFVHQSNGRAGENSRSWNRLYALILLERGNWALSVKPWIWVSTDKDKNDNPDIDDYMGHGEVRVAYGHKGHVFSAMSRNQLESGFDRGAVEVSWSFPIFDYPYLKGYVQYFYGYGESLIDYNQKVNRLGVGISVTDWLYK